jgi:hypothetical protein
MFMLMILTDFCLLRLQVPKIRLHHDRRSIGQPVLVSGTHLGPATNFLFSLLIISRQLLVRLCGVPSLTGGQLCSFQLLLGLASAVFLGSESRGTHDNIILSQFFKYSQPGGPDSCIYFPQEQGSPVIPPGIVFV